MHINAINAEVGQVRIRYNPGKRTEAFSLDRLMAVLNGHACIVDNHGHPIQETTAVICRRKVKEHLQLPVAFGVSLTVIPLKQVVFLVRGPKSNPLIPRDITLPSGRCKDAGPDCGNCCNNGVQIRKMNGSR